MGSSSVGPFSCFSSSAAAFLFFFAFIASAFVPGSLSIPFIVLHGISNQCSNKGMKLSTRKLSEWSKSQGYCIEIGNGVWDSWFKPLQEQTEIVCNKVKQMKELQDGYSIVGYSQGSLIGRGVVEFCDGGPPVRNLVSLGGPHAGTAGVPKCGTRIFCNILHKLIRSKIYSNYIQSHFAPSGYLTLPNNNPGYLSKSRFLPKLNNELPDKRDATYKHRLASLQNLVLIMFEVDTILVPTDSAWFGYYRDGASGPVLPPWQTELYTEDWIGLKSLDNAGRVKYVAVPGDHLQIDDDEMKKFIVPYLKNNTYKGNIPVLVLEPLSDGSSARQQQSPVKSFLEQLVGVNAAN